MSTETTNFDHGAVAQAFADSMQGFLSSEEIADIAADVRASGAAQQYPAKANVISAIFYLRFIVEVTADRGYGHVLKTFTGNAGGLSSPGGGQLFGTVFTNDLAVLYADTSRFQFNSSPVALSMLFFNKSNKLLGNYMSGGVSSVGGIGGGKGSWK